MAAERFRYTNTFESPVGRFNTFVPVAGDQFSPVLSFYAARNPNATNSTLLSSGLFPTGGLGLFRSASVVCYSARVSCPSYCAHLFLLLPWMLPVWSYSGLTELPAGVSSSAPTIYSQSGVSPQRLRGLALVRDTCSRTPIARCASVSQRRSW